MLVKRIIPCLDMKDGRVVKGRNFQNLANAGDPLILAKKYNNEGADELAFLDISATLEKRRIREELVEMVAREIFIPFTVGGGISTVEDMRRVLVRGADKVSVNSAAVLNSELISEAANTFGSQCVVLAVDAKKCSGKWEVFIKGGREWTGWDALEWIKNAVKLGAGEILLTSIDTDGMTGGFNIEYTKKIAEMVNVPVIASGGAGKLEDFRDVLTEGEADAALAASVFHFGKYTIGQVKDYLKRNNLLIRE